MMKKLLFIVLALALTLSLAACGACKHTDENGDGICDKCEEKFETEAKDVLLVDEDGAATFQIVLANNVDTKIKAKLQGLVADLEDVDIEVNLVEDKADNAEKCEVLIGDVQSRGEKFFVDGHTLGSKGYIIKIVDGKIIINGGSSDALDDAINIFIEEILEFDGDEIWDVTMTVDQQVDEAQTDYNVTALKLAGADMKGYTIAANTLELAYNTAAKSIQDTIYKQTGYWLEIVSLDKADKSIVIKSVDRVYGEDSFKAYVSGTQLLVECAFDNKLTDSIASFITTTFVGKEGEINLEGTVYKKDISFVTYEEFGATNNGKTDNDFEAIYKAHKFANAGGQKVIISGSPTYCVKQTKVGNKIVSAEIMTDTDWGNAKFIFDDSSFSLYTSEGKDLYSVNIFEILPSEAGYKIEAEDLPEGFEIKIGMTKLDITFDRTVVLVPYYEGHRVYRRRGYGAYYGDPMHEVLVVDKDGNIREDTPVMWDYKGISYLEVYYYDEETLTVKGGTITTIASKQSIYGPNFATDPTDYHNAYYHRGIVTTRANTLIEGVKHYIEGEVTLKEHAENLTTGVAYRGFFYAANTSDVTLKNCVLTGHRCYTKPKSLGGGGTQGTYDFGANCVNKIVLDGCVQSNFWITVDPVTGIITPASEDTPGAVSSMARERVFRNPDVSTGSEDIRGALMHWGIGGTNFCKNMQYLNSKLSRFDAHAGLLNGKVINSEVNVLALTGKGEMIIENTKLYVLAEDSTYNNILHLRADYGSTWDGTITMKNLDAFLYDYGSYTPFIIMHTYTNWDYGYIAAYPSLIFDNVSFYNAKTYYETREIVPLDSETEIVINSGSHIKDYPSLHLPTVDDKGGSTKHPIICYWDNDGDGWVDYDWNKDGVIGEGDVPFDRDKMSQNDNGTTDTDSFVNLNPVKPPEFIKILNHSSNKIVVTDTSEEANGGFFGNTKFYYAEDKYYTGTGMDKADEDNFFVFE